MGSEVRYFEYGEHIMHLGEINPNILNGNQFNVTSKVSYEGHDFISVNCDGPGGSWVKPCNLTNAA